ncbi:hypothetical protein [Flavobacterium suzhouense]|uniref:Uncharacterized protein n=1 Tax=Flavobacterium suzhouense TaxID=1529638 RepID=A0ABW5NUI5_9FLAO
MKKFTSLLVMLLLLVVTTGNAQTSLYTFSQSTGTYTEITGGTVLISCLDCGTTYDTNSYPVTLPTAFLFNGTPVTDVVRNNRFTTIRWRKNNNGCKQHYSCRYRIWSYI